jgi:ectoine hydroxylase-related dioxygenase (phytanoyl-CoA dioxygenase family)
MDSKEKQFYDDHGYLIVRGAVVGAQLARLKAELTDCQTWVETGRWFGNHLMENEHSARVIFDPYSLCPTLRELVASATFRDRARGMLEAPLRLDHSKLMCKAARTGTPQPPHQDYYYWQGKKANQVACFLCIDPCTVENGCLRVYPGSHKHGLLAHHEEYHEVTGERHWVCEIPAGCEEVAFIGEPGDVVFFGSLTIHRSEANVSAHSRRGVIFEYDELGNLPFRPGWGAPTKQVQWQEAAP